MREEKGSWSRDEEGKEDRVNRKRVSAVQNCRLRPLPVTTVAEGG